MKPSTLYVPILKWKNAEREALSDVKDADKMKITPILEIVLPTVQRHKDKDRKIKKTDEEMLSEMVAKYKDSRLDSIPKEIADSWGATPVFIDFTYIHNGSETTALKVESIEKFYKKSEEISISAIPIMNLHDVEEIQHATKQVIEQDKRGFCIRIGTNNLNDMQALNTHLNQMIATMDVEKERVDLLIDLKDTVDSHTYAKLFAEAQKIADLQKWRSFTFASGAFPVDLTEYNLDEPKEAPRLDWQNWLQQIKKQLVRRPTYADYTIRAPLFNESLQFYPATASIKYTLKNGWYIMKGKVLGFKHYLANAKLLVESSGHFFGATFSEGDRYIAEKAKHFEAYAKNPEIKGTGTSSTWISAGIKHHVAVVVNQVSSL